ncbi:unnamed protein product, partial [Mesorhabditis belari]|uniref:C6 domain-containing protein n=1 Tax=Mesorhabditis belari TaxID=2138241 RepID=A0AAF3EYT0_9BILA
MTYSWLLCLASLVARLLSAGAADCASCSFASPALTINDFSSGSGYKPFDSDCLTRNADGCVVRVMTCASTVPGYMSSMRYNGPGFSGILNAIPSNTINLTCSTDGAIWQLPTYPGSPYIANVTKVGCQPVTCETQPALCVPEPPTTQQSPIWG